MDSSIYTNFLEIKYALHTTFLNNDSLDFFIVMNCTVVKNQSQHYMGQGQGMGLTWGPR